jgi:hypothetical protein
MSRSAKPIVIEDLDWQTIMDRFPKRWVALQIDELSNDGVRSGSLISSSRDEDAVRAKLLKFRAEHPGKMIALFNTLPLKRGLDVLLNWPY